MTSSVIADTNALYRLLSRGASGHEQHRKALASMDHLVISPLVLAELDYLVSQRSGAAQAISTIRFVERYAATNRFEIPDLAPHMSTAVAIMEGYRDADQGRGVGLTDAMNVALAATYHTNRVFSSDGHFRMMRPLTGHAAFELLPEDL